MYSLVSWPQFSWFSVAFITSAVHNLAFHSSASLLSVSFPFSRWAVSTELCIKSSTEMYQRREERRSTRISTLRGNGRKHWTSNRSLFVCVDLPKERPLDRTYYGTGSFCLGQYLLLYFLCSTLCRHTHGNEQRLCNGSQWPPAIYLWGSVPTFYSTDVQQTWISMGLELAGIRYYCTSSGVVGAVRFRGEDWNEEWIWYFVWLKSSRTSRLRIFLIALDLENFSA